MMPPRKQTSAQTTSRKRTHANPTGTPSSSTAPGSKRRKLNGISTAATSSPASHLGRPQKTVVGPDAYDIPDSDEEVTDHNDISQHTSRTTKVPAKRTPLPTSQQPKRSLNKRNDTATSKPQEVARHASPEPQQELEDELNQSPSKGRGSTPRVKPLVNKLVPVGSARKGRTSLVPKEPLKSILSPTKNRGIRSQKSVVFNDEKIELNLGTPTPVKRGRGRPRKLKPPTVARPVIQPPPQIILPPNNHYEDDDEPCAICRRPETTPSNDILFCDKCDIAVHQKCYGIKTVPKGDWFCRKCSGEGEPSLEPIKKKGRGKGKKTAKTPVRAQVEPAEAEEEQESDTENINCDICGNPDTKPDDDIIFCDNCEFAVHQKCYNVLEIPEGDWLCQTCAKKDSPPAVYNGGEQQPVTTACPAELSATPDIPNFEQHLRSFQRVLLDRCTGQRRLKLRGQDENYQKAYNLVEQTVLAGEGNSMLVIGARGVGKTTLVESIISSLKTGHEDDFHVVRLNGFIHTDDKLALREIWRQLAKARGIQDQEANTTNYADTMASLLGLLSRSEEITGEETEEGTAAKSVVFIIDEFDLFATHARQTLLYNLFDIAQARKAPIAVLGLTTRIEVVDLLEKRVKSRFSHRNMLLSMPKTLHMFWDICKQGLLIAEEDLESEGINTYLEGHDKFFQYWTKKIQRLRNNADFEDHLKMHYYGTKSVSSFLKTCILPLSQLSATKPTLAIVGDGAPGTSLEAPDSKLHLLSSLADLDLALLISAARLDIVAHTDTVNFAMAYDEYTGLMTKQRVATASAGIMALGAGAARVWGRSIAAAAWERLVSLGLLISSGIGGGGVRKPAAGGLENKMWKVDVALEEIPGAVDLSGMLGRWCKEI